MRAQLELSRQQDNCRSRAYKPPFAESGHIKSPAATEAGHIPDDALYNHMESTLSLYKSEEF
jgi:hypothetical protein